MHRYERQMRFTSFGEKGQRALTQTHAVVVGAGALGSASSEMLVRAGIGTITLLDRDVIELSNLHRQQLYDERDVAEQLPKAIAAKKRLSRINRDVVIHAKVVDVTPQNVETLLQHADVVLDATDNIETRLLINDVAWKYNIPFFMGAGTGSYGITYPIGIDRNEPCLHCLIDILPATTGTCDSEGVISPTTITVAARQVTQVLQYVRGVSNLPHLQSFDLWNDTQSRIRVTSLKKDDCPTCQRKQYPYLNGKGEMKAHTLCGQQTVQLVWPHDRQFDLSTIAATLRRETEKLIHNDYVISATISPYRFVFFQDGRILIHGTDDAALARTLLSRLLG